MYFRRAILVSLLPLLSACGASRRVENHFGASELVGIWRMIPLRNGIANVVEFTPSGKSTLYSFNCLTPQKDDSPEISSYTVDAASREIRLDTDGEKQVLKVSSFSANAMSLSQQVGDESLAFAYKRGAAIEPLCDGTMWEQEKKRRTPFSSADFPADPRVPPSVELARYVGRWVDDKGALQIEIRKDTQSGVYVLRNDPSANWNHLYGDVSWKGRELHFKDFAYSDKSELFSHPYHKSSTKFILAPGREVDKVRLVFVVGRRKHELNLRRE